MNKYPMGPSFTPIKSCILNQNLQKPTPRNQENIGQLVCSRLVKIVHYTDGCPLNFEIGQLTTAKKGSWKSISSIWSLCTAVQHKHKCPTWSKSVYTKRYYVLMYICTVHRKLYSLQVLLACWMYLFMLWWCIPQFMSTTDASCISNSDHFLHP